MIAAKLEEIDTSRNKSGSSLPLVLIHDGGGTIFQYYTLGSLDRDVYGIANPYFGGDEQAALSVGIPDLAAEYAKVIQENFGSTSILVGGWSLGGMLALEVCRILAFSGSKTRARGLLMIDSRCPWADNRAGGGRVQPSFQSRTSQAMKDKVVASFAHAGRMIREWEKPGPFEAPSAAMIRAKEPMPSANYVDGSKPERDYDGKLGWSAFESVRFRTIVDVPGNHFSMFDVSRLDGLTDKIKEACNVLEMGIP